jgi:ferredoxin, 2Fe-2S
MLRVTFVTPKKIKIDATANNGDVLMQVALANAVPGITADCGGQMTCGTCHVHIAEDYFDLLPAPSPDEQFMLEDGVADPQTTSRLSCQVVLDDTLDGIVVTVPRQF